MSFLTVDEAAVEAAQREALAGELNGARLAELRSMKRDPVSITTKLNNRLRVVGNRAKRLARALKATERLPELEERLAKAREDLTVQPGAVERIETEARTMAKLASGADSEALEAAEAEVATLERFLEGIQNKDGDALIAAAAYLDEVEERRRRAALESRERNKWHAERLKVR